MVHCTSKTISKPCAILGSIHKQQVFSDNKDNFILCLKQEKSGTTKMETSSHFCGSINNDRKIGKKNIQGNKRFAGNKKVRFKEAVRLG